MCVCVAQLCCDFQADAIEVSDWCAMMKIEAKANQTPTDKIKNYRGTEIDAVLVKYKSTPEKVMRLAPPPAIRNTYVCSREEPRHKQAQDLPDCGGSNFSCGKKS